jgi:L-threonylcarbamoyladenylate synthase
VKGREPAKAVLLLIPAPRVLPSLVEHVPLTARTLMDAFWPGPLTLVFRARPGLSPRLLGGGQTLGIRLSSSPIVSDLLDRLGGPITGTSANLSGAPPARTASEVASQLGDRVDLILDGGPTQEERPSTVVDVSGTEVLVPREGAIPSNKVWRALGVDPKG